MPNKKHGFVRGVRVSNTFLGHPQTEVLKESSLSFKSHGVQAAGLRLQLAASSSLAGELDRVEIRWQETPLTPPVASFCKAVSRCSSQKMAGCDGRA